MNSEKKKKPNHGNHLPIWIVCFYDDQENKADLGEN